MDISADVSAIVSQAPDWNFAGDCALLQLMKRISQNLEERGTRTNNNLIEFEKNVKRLDIDLDNANNSLRSLQFGQQFVEYRVEDVDDADFALPEAETSKRAPPPDMTSQEMAAEFLQNNFQMLRRNFEPVTLEVPDSDDEDNAHSTTIYRANNPYDAIPLPYLIGSREWQEHKHAGLYDSAENSEDEAPEQFSSSSGDEFESAPPKATPRRQLHEPQQLSDSSSLASLPKDPPLPTAMPSSIIEAAAHPRAQPRPILSSSARINPHERDLFNALRASPPSDDPPSTSSSLNSSPAISHVAAGVGGLPRKDVSLSSSSSSVSKPPAKLFDDVFPVARPTLPAVPTPATTPAPTPVTIPIQPEAEVKPSATASQIKRKPVNLFDDDEFNSFMSEIVDKVQSKSGNSQAAKPKVIAKPAEVTPAQPLPPARNLQTIRSVNLFDDSPPLTPPAGPAEAKSARTLPSSLFDDNLEDDDDFLSSFASKPKTKPLPTRTALFDDEDELDIEDIFAKQKKPSLPAKTSALLEEQRAEENVTDIFAAEAKTKPAQRKTLFDDLGDDDLFGTPKSKQNPFVAEVHATPKHSEENVAAKAEPVKPMLKTQLFSDDFSDEEDLIIKEVGTLGAPKVKDMPQTAVKPLSKAALIGDDLSSEEGERVNEVASSELSNEPKLHMSQAKLFDDDLGEEGDQKSTSVLPKKLESRPKLSKSKLFEDDFSDVEDETVKNVGLADPPKEVNKPQTSVKPELPNVKFEVDLSDEENQKVKTKITSELPKILEDQPKRFKTQLFEDDLSDEELLLAQPQQVEKDENPLIEQKQKEMKMKSDLLQQKATNEESKEVPQFPPKPQINPKEIGRSKQNEEHQKELSLSSKTEQEKIPKPIESHPEIVKPTNKTIAHQIIVESTHTDNILGELFDKPQLKHIPTPAPAAEDPIISLVAEIGYRKSSSESDTQHQPKELASAQQLMQNYSSLFSDEPPDDSEFFQSLGNSSASKIFDHEQDFFEPALPKLPKAAVAGTPNVEQTGKEYGGMRLFSDVPPDDDDDGDGNEEEVEQQTTTKRIHTIFYDDFSETATAKSSVVANPSIFNKEPPPVDVVDRNVVSNSSDLRKSSSSVKKLQIPNIQINVKALLPSAGVLPKFAKREEAAKTDQQEQSEEVQQEKPSEQPLAFSSDTENILKCLGKTRARGPARRPSTRRARQEHYAKTLLEQSEEDSMATSSSSSFSTSNSQLGMASNSQHEKIIEARRTTAMQPSEVAKAAESNRSVVKSLPGAPAPVKPMTASFLDSDEEDDALFAAVKQLPRAPPAAPITLPTNTVEDLNTLLTRRPAAVAPLMRRSSSTSVSSDEDQALLNAPKNSLITATAVPPKSATLVRNPTQPPAYEPKPKSSQLPPAFFTKDDDDSNSLFSPSVHKVPAVASTVTPYMPPFPASPKDPAVAAVKSAVKVIKASSSFLDSDDDDDDDALFAPVTKSKAPVRPIASAVPQVKNLVRDPAKIKPKPVGLFADSDEDDDDLFGSAASSKARSVIVPASSQAKAVLEQLPKKLPIKDKLPVKVSKSLFSDDEDDDDLFGGAGPKSAAKLKSNPQSAIPKPSRNNKKVPVTATSVPAPQSGSSDNPLADLLNP